MDIYTMKPLIIFGLVAINICKLEGNLRYLTAHGLDGSARIHGGEDADKDEYPWQILLLYNNSFRCGGSILNGRTVLTAGHCVDHDPEQKLAKFQVVAGDHDLSVDGGSEQVRGIQEIKIHPDYQSDPVFVLHNDIAILITDERFVWSSSVRRVPRLSNRRFDRRAVRTTHCVVTGWGEVDAVPPLPDFLQELTPTDIKSYNCCRMKVLPTGHDVTCRMVCTIDENAGACYGDSGGPMGCYFRGCFYQIGVISWTATPGICAGTPKVFTRISWYRRWIALNSY